MGDLARGGGSDTEAERKLRDLALKVEANLATPKEMRAFVLGQAIGMVKRRLELREMVLTTIEQHERNERYMASMSPTENVADRFARAETTLERRMYRALGALIAMRATQEKAKSLPEPFSVSTAS